MNSIATKVVVFFFSLWLSCVQAIKNGTSFPTILAFGDSIFDTGNNNRLITAIRSDFKPYGRDFPTHKPTGRFGNGRVLSDLVAASLGRKDLLPAFRTRNLRIGELLTGVSFASGGSGLDKLTASIQGVISIEDQVKDFQRYIEKLNEEYGAANIKDIIANAVILISAGNSDISITYYTIPARRPSINIATYTDMLITWQTVFIKKLYELGARKFAVLGTLPLGCLPGARQETGDLICNPDINYAARLYNQQLSDLVDKFGQNRPDTKFVYIDMYTKLLDVITKPKQYGFTTARPCCCSVMTPIPCSSSTSHVFWDFGHPSEKAYKIVLPDVVNAIRKNLA